MRLFMSLLFSVCIAGTATAEKTETISTNTTKVIKDSDADVKTGHLPLITEFPANKTGEHFVLLRLKANDINLVVNPDHATPQSVCREFGYGDAIFFDGGNADHNGDNVSHIDWLICRWK